MSGPSVRKVSSSGMSAGHPTDGMVRSEAIVLDDVWSGTAVTEPGAASGWHHHGDHDTVIYVVRGSIEVETADGIVTGEPGDFLHVPPHSVHRESNPSDRLGEVVLFRRGSGPVVVNVDGPVDGSPT